jgi:hypothetical protein
MAEASLVAVAFFAPWSVFIVAGANCLFIWFALVFEHHTNDLGQLMATSSYDVFIRPFILQIFVALITYIWVRSATQAIMRADRAEELSALEKREIERQHREIEQKRQLDQGIELILQTHVRVANGDLNARAPLTKENLLWQIAYALNNLLARQQRLAQVEDELTQAKTAAAHFAQAIHNAKRTKSSVQLTRTGTFLDQLIIELGTGTEAQHLATSTFIQPQNTPAKEPMPFVQSPSIPANETSSLPLRKGNADARWSAGRSDLTRGDH